jgi:sugar lactone lactonase YvrE
MRMNRRTFLGTSAVAIGMTSFTITAASPLTISGLLKSPTKLWDGFSSPVGMAFGIRGNLYVAEWSANRVSRIDSDGRRSIFAEGLSGPSGLAISTDGTIYIASYSLDEVYRFTPSGVRSVHVTG